MKLEQTWDLNVFFEGGSHSPRLQDQLNVLEGSIQRLSALVQALPDPAGETGVAAWHLFVEEYFQAGQQLTQTASYLACLMAQDVKDEKAKLLYGRIIQLDAGLEAITNELDGHLVRTADSLWQSLISDARMVPVRFLLEERRTTAREKLSPHLETLASDLSVDGYHAWSTLYDTIVGRITVSFEEEGTIEQLSVGQAYNKFSHPDRTVRARLFDNWEQAWSGQAELIAGVLNSLSGFRLNLYRHRQWESVLKEPLQRNRMNLHTLDAMWQAVTEGKERLAAYLKRKASLMGAEQLAWYDLTAAVGGAAQRFSYEQAAEFVADHFRRFSPRMADFAWKAVTNRWIEAEDRSGKQPGGFCTDFPETRQTRIFMTFGGEPQSVNTLAHELGHAFHADVMFDMHPAMQRYPYNLAETASTFAEAITVDAAIRHSQSTNEKIALLDEKLSNATAYLMNLHSRFLFETRFYEARRQGQLSMEELNHLMEAAQREGYHGALSVYHPLFWASKGHFYTTSLPFYNFPYTFGYLFSAGVYARALEEGTAFEPKYIALLRDTGSMTVEELANRHLGADLSRPDFWAAGVRLVMADVDEFLRLTQ